MWEISENLARAELTVLERDQHVAEWVKLAWVVSVQSEQKPKRGRPEGGVRAAARELGVGERDAQRAAQIDRLTPEAKDAAHTTGLDDNRTALLREG